MIPYRELRIGNWVIVNSVHRQIFGVVSGTQIAAVWFTRNGNESLGSHMVDPIALTQGILQSAGFITPENEMDVILWEKGSFWVSQEGVPVNDQPIIFEYEDANCNTIKVELKWLHQLQNLYYELTGEELIIHITTPA